ncbi:gfo/Idh/MocA family oxidoreductase [Verrucomicrobia bacterium LW23]|nr:gfo/Idh/MocA family oxidoreductase [Verrucomicrobia bacterium LW23]
MTNHTPVQPKASYGFEADNVPGTFAAPDLPYRPTDPLHYRPNIGLIACGGITSAHLKAYTGAGYNVVALCDTDPTRAEKRRDEFYPSAQVYSDYRDLLARDDIEVVDIAAHPIEREPIIPEALRAHKHVLSQKPFVLDLDLGEAFVKLADDMGVRLAVNQNGRWAPYFSYIRHAIEAGLLGDVATANFELHWDHNWTSATPFNNLHHLVLFDYTIHWFDAIHTFFPGRRATRVYASVECSRSQTAKPPLLAHVLVDFDGCQATIMVNGDTLFGPETRTSVIGSKGTIRSVGPSLQEQQVTLITAEGIARPALKGSWVPDGMHGSMGELLCAIEEGREPRNSARNNLRSLELCFAAIASADTHRPQIPGQVRSLPSSCVTRSGLN